MATEGIPIRRVTREEFEAITCNQCGDCCELFYHPAPDELKIAIAKERTKVMGEWTDEQLIESGWSTEQITDSRRWISWAEQIIPLAPVVPIGVETGYKDPRYTYKCLRFVRVDEAHGYCSDYENRPKVCSDFPYRSPQLGHGTRCAWAVEVVDPWYKEH